MGMCHQKVIKVKSLGDLYISQEAFLLGEVIPWQRKAINVSSPLC
jgi:hypothetical protein